MSFLPQSPARSRRLSAAALTGALTLSIANAVPALAATGPSMSVNDARQHAYKVTDADFVRAPLANTLLDLNPVTPVVVLGARLEDDCSAPNVLTDRLSAATDLLSAHPRNPVIVTGGATRPGCPSEAAVMEKDLRNMGVTNKVIKEERAGSTLQNVEYTAGTIHRLGGTAIVVTSDPHYIRALKNYRDAGIRAFGYVGGEG